MVTQNYDHSELLAEVIAIETAAAEAVREALLRHKQAGNPVAVWNDGKVEWIAADKISLEGFETAATDSTAGSKPTL